MKIHSLALIAFGISLLLSSSALERLEPARGAYFGFTLGSGQPVAQLSERLGFTPAVFVRFYDFSTDNPSFDPMRAFLDEVSAIHGIAMLTLEPWSGLQAVTDSQCRQLAELCAAAERQGIGGIFIRFCHEMNGNWYPWGQRPALFKSKFRLLSGHVHALTARTAMVWAPNYGVGYPFGSAIPAPGTADFIELDTNPDGRITDRDDMYEPFYPGHDAVDWVGMSLYHWGTDFPWLENELPAPDSFARSLTGNFQGAIPNFYARYCLDPARQKPMLIAETAAFYNTQMPGPAELSIKQAWWTQVFAAATQFPMVKCINWFDELKRESIAQNHLIDWRVSATPEIRAPFLHDLSATSVGGQPWFLTAQDTQTLVPYFISAKYLPDILPVAGQVNVSLEVKATAPCDLVIDLLDENFVWQGGTRVSITAPRQTVTTSFRLVQALTDQTSYRWSIFLTPTGKDYLAALAWYRGPNPSDDPDGDGVSNKDEFIAGTSPRDPLDLLSLDIQQQATSAIVSWNSRLDRQYRLFASPDLKSWSPVSQLIPGTGQRLSLSHAAHSNSPPTFYRIQVLRP